MLKKTKKSAQEIENGIRNIPLIRSPNPKVGIILFLECFLSHAKSDKGNWAEQKRHKNPLEMIQIPYPSGWSVIISQSTQPRRVSGRMNGLSLKVSQNTFTCPLLPSACSTLNLARTIGAELVEQNPFEMIEIPYPSSWGDIISQAIPPGPGLEQDEWSRLNGVSNAFTCPPPISLPPSRISSSASGASRYDVRNILGFLTPSPLSAFWI